MKGTMKAGTSLLLALACLHITAQTVTIDISPAGRRQLIDGFGTCLSSNEGQQSWWQSLYFDELQCSMLRMDLTPHFKAPYTGMNGTYNSPWYHNNPPLPGPDTNNVRTYTNAADYKRLYNGWHAPIAVMGPDINQNTNYFDFNYGTTPVAGLLARLGTSRSNQLGPFKLIGSLWSPAPWVKISSGNVFPNQGGTPMPVPGTPWPFIWFDNFAGGKLDTSGTPLSDFDDSALGGSGPTSALTQFARCTAAWLRGFQNAYGVRLYSVSIQNELNFEEFYGSCTYPLSAGYITALKAVRAELDRYPDLTGIQIMGPEDLLGGDAYGLWQYGGGSTTTHKNLQYLQNIAADPQAAAAEAFFCIHGYASDGISASDAVPTAWNWWLNGWSSSPAAGIPANVHGYAYYGKKSWMSETSGEQPAWLAPASGFPNQGAWSLALRIQQALTAGQESAWLYWQMSDGNALSASTLADHTLLQSSPKFVAAKHFFRYVRPGARCVQATVAGATELSASAFLHETNQTMTVVLVNSSSNSIQAVVNSPAAPSGLTFWQVFTSRNSNYWQSSNAPITNNQVVVTVPGYGVAPLYGIAPPVLSASEAGSNRVALSWSATPTSFVLQSTTNLAAPGAWGLVTNSATTSNGISSVTVPLDSAARAFRLVYPGP
jgi:O-glycosyl hydrolase